MGTHNYAGIDVEVKEDILTPDIHWQNRHDTFKRVKRSRSIYMALSPEQKLVLTKKLRGALAVMYDRAEEWIPDSFTGNELGSALKVEMTFVMTEVDSSVSDILEASSYKLKEALDGMMSAMDDLDD